MTVKPIKNGTVKHKAIENKAMEKGSKPEKNTFNRFYRDSLKFATQSCNSFEFVKLLN